MKIMLVILVGYIIGCFSSSYFLGKIFKKQDIRNYGSGNAGSTNALRVFGKKIGCLTFMMDIAKGIIAVLIGKWIMGFDGGLLGGISVVLGHNWPIFLGFKGGKGVATSLGVLFIIHWQTGIICLIIGLSIIVFSKYVSLASIGASVIAPFALLIMDRKAPKNLHLTMLLLAIMAIFRHKDNIKRLIEGKENKLGNKKG